MTVDLVKNRLKELFSSFNITDQESIPNPLRCNRSMIGWVWECDAEGHYTACSPEVEEVFGHQAEKFIGQALTEFALHPRSKLAFQHILRNNQFPHELRIPYQTPYLGPTTIALCVMKATDREEDHRRWRGFAQVVEMDFEKKQ
jgi:PAS domain-containing protein